MPLRLAFMGTPALAADLLGTLLTGPNPIVAVYAQPDRPSGRNRKLTPPPTKERGAQHGIPVEQPVNFKSSEAVDRLKSYAPDLLVVAAYGLILPQPVLTVPRLGAINVHPSLLPKYRGAAPMQWALLNGDVEAGITLMQMDAGMDTGDIIIQERLPLDETTDIKALSSTVARRSGEMLLELFKKFPNGDWPRTPQDNAAATMAPKITKEMGQLDFRQPARTLHNKVRALADWPTAFIPLADGPLKVLESEIADAASNAQPGTLTAMGKDSIVVACGEGALRLLTVIPPGRKPMDARSWANGARLGVNDRIGSCE